MAPIRFRYVPLLAFLATLNFDPTSSNAEAPRFLFGTAAQLPGPVNSGDVDVWNMVTTDGLQMYLTSKQIGGTYDIYVAERANIDEPFGEPKTVANVNSPSSDIGPSLSSNGLELYFWSYFPDRISHVWLATRPDTSAEFGEPSLVEEVNSTWANTSGPSLSGDGLSLYFYAEDAAHIDNGDIFVSTRASLTDPWGPGEDVGAGINRNGWDFAPRVSADGLSLFFTAYNRAGQRTSSDDYDTYVSTRNSTSDPWGAAVNLGNSINGPQDEQFAILDAIHATLYFTRSPYDQVETASKIWSAPVLPFEGISVLGNGGTYAQDFAALGPDASADTPLPAGWTFTANDIIFNNATTDEFPASRRSYAGVYNGGSNGDPDRALVTAVSLVEGGELDFRAVVEDAPVQALRLGFDLEAWQVFGGVNQAEAAFHIVLEADAGDGFSQVADLGMVTTGPLTQPPTGSLVDGNDPTYRVNYDSGPRDVDVPQDATLRLRWISTEASRRTVVFGLDNVSLRFAAPGDANIDGVFNSTDLIDVLANGEYEDTVVSNSTWSEGDWNNDHEFDSGDLVSALATGGYEQGPRPAVAAVPEPSNCGLMLLGAMAVLRRRR